MTQNRKCENAKSQSARLLLTTCNCKCYSCDHRTTWVQPLLLTRFELICFDMRAFAVYLHKMTAISAQCHWQSIGCSKYTFSIAGLVIQSAACGLQKLERKTRETWKYVHVISRSWRMNSADSPLFTKVMATIATHRASKARWLHRKAFVYFSAMQAQILLERSWYKLEYLWAAPVCRTPILKLSKPIQFS